MEPHTDTPTISDADRQQERPEARSDDASLGNGAVNQLPHAVSESDTMSESDFQAKQSQLVKEYEAQRTALLAERDRARIQEDESYHGRRRKLAIKLDQASRKIRRRHKERLRDARDARDQTKREAEERFATTNHRLSEGLSCRAEICSLQRQAVEEVRQQLVSAVISAAGAFPDEIGEPWTDDQTAHPRRRFARAMQRAKQELAQVESYLKLRKNMKPAAIGMAFGSALIFAMLVGIATNWSGGIWMVAASVGGPALLLGVAYAVVIPRARKTGEKAYCNCHHAVSHAEDAVAAMFYSARNKFEPLLQAADQRRQSAVDGAAQNWKQKANTLKLMRDKRLEDNKEKVKERKQKIDSAHRRRVEELAEEFLPQLETLAHEHEQRMSQLVKWQRQQMTECGASLDGNPRQGEGE